MVMKMIIIYIEGGCGTIHYIIFLRRVWKERRLSLQLACVMCFILIFSGCSSSESGSTAGSNGNKADSSETVELSDPFANIPLADITDTQTGISDMSSLIKSLKQAVEADETAEAKALVEQMAGLWNAIKADIEAVDEVKFQALQDDLGKLIQATKASKWDKEPLIQLDYKLYQSFRDLKQELQGQ